MHFLLFLNWIFCIATLTNYCTMICKHKKYNFVKIRVFPVLFTLPTPVENRTRSDGRAPRRASTDLISAEANGSSVCLSLEKKEKRRGERRRKERKGEEKREEEKEYRKRREREKRRRRGGGRKGRGGKRKGREKKRSRILRPHSQIPV